MIPEAPPGARSNGLAPVSVAERSLAAGAWQWAGLIAVAVAAAVVTGLVNHVVAQVTDHHGIRTMFDAAAFLGTYVAFFVLKYAVFNRLFGGQPRGATAEGG